MYAQSALLSENAAIQDTMIGIVLQVERKYRSIRVNSCRIGHIDDQVDDQVIRQGSLIRLNDDGLMSCMGDFYPSRFFAEIRILEPKDGKYEVRQMYRFTKSLKGYAEGHRGFHSTVFDETRATRLVSGLAKRLNIKAEHQYHIGRYSHSVMEKTSQHKTLKKVAGLVARNILMYMEFGKGCWQAHERKSDFEDG